VQTMEPPKANPEKLPSIVEGAHAAKVVLPSFQRSFVCDRDNVETLLASVLEGYFIGTLLMLDTPGDDPMFPCRMVEGLERGASGCPARITQHAAARTRRPAAYLLALLSPLRSARRSAQVGEVPPPFLPGPGDRAFRGPR